MPVSEPDKTRVCSKCRIEKSLSNFTKDKNRKYGRRYTCKECDSKAGIKWRKQHPGRAAAIVAKSYRKHRAKRILEGRCYHSGITVKEYLEMFRTHNGKCDICGVSHLELNKGLCIDHNHETGKVRGLLCDSCNKMLGHSKDNPVLLEKAAVYLRKEFANEFV